MKFLDVLIPKSVKEVFMLKKINKASSEEIDEVVKSIPSVLRTEAIINAVAEKYAHKMSLETPKTGPRERYYKYHPAEGYEETETVMAGYDRWGGDYYEDQKTWVETKPSWEEEMWRETYSEDDLKKAKNMLVSLQPIYHELILQAMRKFNEALANGIEKI